MRKELEGLQEQIDDGKETAEKSIKKLQANQEGLNEFIAENEGDIGEVMEEIIKLEQNLGMYREVVSDPVTFLAEVETRLADEGEELEGEGDERGRALVKAAMKSRHLTPTEE